MQFLSNFRCKIILAGSFFHKKVQSMSRQVLVEKSTTSWVIILSLQMSHSWMHSLTLYMDRWESSLPCGIKKSLTHSEKCKVKRLKQSGVKLMVAQDDIMERDTQYPLSDDVMRDTLWDDKMERGIPPYRLGWHHANPILIHSKRH